MKRIDSYQQVSYSNKDTEGKIINLLQVRLEELTKKLVSNERQFGYTLDSMMEGVQIIDFGWNLIYANNAAVAYGPYRKEEIIGYPLMEKYPGIEKTDVFAQMSLSMNDRKSRTMQTYYTFPNGGGGFYELSIQPIPEGIFILSIDITERKRAEEELKINLKELADYKIALDEASIVAITDQKGIIKHVNNNFCRISKYSAKELIGKDHRVINSGYHPKEYINNLWKTIASGNIWKGELKNKAKDGSFYWVDTTIIPFLDGEGKPFQYLAIRSDITERKNAEEKLQKANRLYKFLSSINQSIVHVSDEQQLCDKACEIAIHIGGFRLAWISMVDEQDVLQYKSMKGDIEAAKKIFKMEGFDHNDPRFVHVPSAQVMLNGRYAINNNLLEDESFGKLREELNKYGMVASMSVPIRKSGKTIGIFGFLAGSRDFFDSEEIALLEEATDDISFALESIEKAKKHTETEELLERNERRFRALTEKSSDMTILTSEQGMFIYGSPMISKVFGYTAEEFLSQSAFNFFHPDELGGYLEKRKTILDTPGQSFHFQHRLKHKNGHWIWCEGTVTNMLNEPSINAFVANFRDITEKKLAEQVAEFDRNNMNTLINNTNDLLWSVDKNYNLITFNQPFAFALKAITGIDVEQGKNAFAFSIDQAQTDRFKTIYNRAFDGESFTETEHIPAPINTWSEISYCPIRNGEEIIGAACHSRDITHRKKTEEQLLRNEARLNEAQAIALMGNWEVDFATGTSTWSEEACKIYGIPTHETKQSYESWLSFIHPDDKEYVLEVLKEAERTCTDIIITHRIVLKDNSIKYVYAKGKFEFNELGNPTGLHGITQDVTERKLAEMERERMVSDLTQRNKNFEQFSYIVSHNLRAPIANIMGISNILKADLSEADRQRSQAYLFKAVEQLDIVIKDLNEILQVRSTVSENKKKVVFEELANDIESSISELVQKENVQVITDFSGATEIFTLKSYIHSVFYNLISNAIKYKQPGITPIIRIRSELTDGKIRISFRDNGTGIDLDVHGNKLFGLYKRFHANIEGKGMGLFMVKNQVEVMGGTISVSSEPGKGTEFVVELPL